MTDEEIMMSIQEKFLSTVEAGGDLADLAVLVVLHVFMQIMTGMVVASVASLVRLSQ